MTVEAAEKLLRKYYLIKVIVIFVAFVAGQAATHTMPVWFLLFVFGACVSLVLAIVQGVMWLMNIRRDVQLLSLKYHLVFIGVFLFLSAIIHIVQTYSMSY
jgi:hypothetical protein